MAVISRRRICSTAAAAAGFVALKSLLPVTPALAAQTPPLPDFLKPTVSGKVPLTLCMALDASSSINQNEFAIQCKGLAEAFRDEDVINAIINFRQAVHVVVLQYSDTAQMSVDHALLTSRDSILAYANYIESQGRLTPKFTGIAHGLGEAGYLIHSAPYTAVERIVDISGDGVESVLGKVTPGNSDDRKEALESGAKEIDIRRWHLAGLRTTINGLPITQNDDELHEYYGQHVITTPKIAQAANIRQGMLWKAPTYEDYKEAIKSKILSELVGAIAGNIKPYRYNSAGEMVLAA